MKRNLKSGFFPLRAASPARPIRAALSFDLTPLARGFIASPVPAGTRETSGGAILLEPPSALLGFCSSEGASGVIPGRVAPSGQLLR